MIRGLMKRIWTAVGYVSGTLAALRLLPWRIRLRAAWPLLRASMPRVASILRDESYAEFDARLAVECPCEHDLPSRLRCLACPKRVTNP